MLDMKNVEKVLACKVIDKPGVYASDEIVSYKCTGDVAKGDAFVVWLRGHVRVVEVISITPAWAYSESRKGLGDMDTMSWVINKVDFKSHNIAKLARSKIRDLRAAMKERRAKALDKKDFDEFVKGLNKKDAAEFLDTQEYIEQLETNPALAENCEW